MRTEGIPYFLFLLLLLLLLFIERHLLINDAKSKF
jgi:hypothetical protein